MISIDQNCHSLWDVVPKLHAIAAAGRAVTHLVEDIDSAFTALGSGVGDESLRLARERFHHSGGADWGAALFYTEFLGRVPVEPRDWEPLTGLKTAALAKKLGRDVEDLYDEFSPSDNWQLVGSSFVGDRAHHRVIGDLTVRETSPHVRELLAIARRDLLRAFPSPASRQRVRDWFAREEALVGRLLEGLADATLPALYEQWTRAHVPDAVRLDRTSRRFACAPAAGQTPPTGLRLLDVFLTDYPRAAALYNEAIEQTGQRLRPLATKEGELPFFATRTRAGRLVRTGLYLDGGNVRIGERVVRLPRAFADLPGALAEAGVHCVAGKAAVLVTQVRMEPGGEPLALPYRGSLYMPAAHAFAQKLIGAGLLPGPVQPVLRVRLRLLDRLRRLETPLRLPAHLAAAMGAEEVPARALGEHHADLAAAAAERLRGFRDEAARRRWQEQTFPDTAAEIAGLDRRRRELARRDPKDPELRAVWKRSRALETELLEQTVRQIDRDTQVAELDYYDSRGAILPWCIALGGEAFYNAVVADAEIYEETGGLEGPNHE